MEIDRYSLYELMEMFQRDFPKLIEVAKESHVITAEEVPNTDEEKTKLLTKIFDYHNKFRTDLWNENFCSPEDLEAKINDIRLMIKDLEMNLMRFRNELFSSMQERQPTPPKRVNRPYRTKRRNT